jgi:hypothetical protein
MKLSDVELAAAPALEKALHSSCPLMQIVYKDVNVFVKVTTKVGRKKVTTQRQILKGISGILQPARMTAVMGASGAGKTSFLNGSASVPVIAAVLAACSAQHKPHTVTDGAGCHPHRYCTCGVHCGAGGWQGVCASALRPLG